MEENIPNRQRRKLIDILYPLRIFCIPQNHNFAVMAAKAANTKLCSVKITNFQDKEFKIQYPKTIRGCNVFIIASTNQPDKNFVLLKNMIDAARRASANTITAVIPYLGYGRGERRVGPRMSIPLPIIIDELEEVGVNRIITMDLHSSVTPSFTKLPIDHLFMSKVLVPKLKKYIQDHGGSTQWIFSTVDVGAVKMVRAWAGFLKCDYVIIDKRKVGPNKNDETKLIGDAKNKNVIIVDDLLDTGGSFCNAVEKLRAGGAKDIIGVCVHTLFSGDATKRLNALNVPIWTSDSVPGIPSYNWIRKFTAANLFGICITRAHYFEPVDDLFPENEDESLIK